MGTTTLSRTLETRKNGGFAPAVVEVFTGGLNTFTLSFQDSPDCAATLPSGATKAVITVRTLPDNMVEVASLGTIDLTGPSVTITSNISGDLKLGYYYLHAVLYNASNVALGVYQGYLVADKAVVPTQFSHLRLDVIRAALADEISAANELLDGQEFGTGDFASAVERSIMTWNNRPPFSSEYYGHDFKYPEMLLNGVCYEVLSSLSHLLQRNRMAYQADGLAIDLEKRVDYYEKRREEYRILWFNGITSIKKAEDLASFTGSLGHRY